MQPFLPASLDLLWMWFRLDPALTLAYILGLASIRMTVMSLGAVVLGFRWKIGWLLMTLIYFVGAVISFMEKPRYYGPWPIYWEFLYYPVVTAAFVVGYFIWRHREN